MAFFFKKKSLFVFANASQSPFQLPSGLRQRLCLFHVSDFPENTYFSEMLFSEMENIFKCLVAFQKMLWKIFSGVWLYGWKSYFLQIFHTAIQPKVANFDNQKPQPPKHHHHNNNKNQNHTEIKITERERSVGRRSVGRRRDHAEARSKVQSGQCNRRIGAHEINWCVRSAQIGARGSLVIVRLD